MARPEVDKAIEFVESALVVVFAYGDAFVAQSFDPDIASQGATVQEALRNLAEALDLAAEG
jgi:predicted RNase H-like HicB family nuclease